MCFSAEYKASITKQQTIMDWGKFSFEVLANLCSGMLETVIPIIYNNQ